MVDMGCRVSKEDVEDCVLFMDYPSSVRRSYLSIKDFNVSVGELFNVRFRAELENVVKSNDVIIGCVSNVMLPIVTHLKEVWDNVAEFKCADVEIKVYKAGIRDERYNCVEVCVELHGIDGVDSTRFKLDCDDKDGVNCSYIVVVNVGNREKTAWISDLKDNIGGLGEEVKDMLLKVSISEDVSNLIGRLSDAIMCVIKDCLGIGRCLLHMGSLMAMYP